MHADAMRARTSARAGWSDTTPTVIDADASSTLRGLRPMPDSSRLCIDSPESYVSTVTSQTTGGKVWPAARTLYDHLASSRTRPPRGKLLELGAGTGWLSMALACDFPALELVVPTEMLHGNAFAWLERNIAMNAEAGLPLSACRAQPLDWSWLADADEASLPSEGDAGEAEARAAALEQLRGVAWDLIVGSDLVYDEEGARALPAAIAALLRLGGGEGRRVLYAHTLGRFEILDRDFLEALHAEGLSAYELGADPPGEGSAESADGADPRAARVDLAAAVPDFSGSLFPEMRVAVLEIEWTDS